MARDFSAATARAFIRFLVDAASFRAERDFPPLEPISLAVNFPFIAPAIPKRERRVKLSVCWKVPDGRRSTTRTGHGSRSACRNHKERLAQVFLFPGQASSFLVGYMHVATSHLRLVYLSDRKALARRLGTRARWHSAATASAFDSLAEMEGKSAPQTPARRTNEHESSLNDALVVRGSIRAAACRGYEQSIHASC